MKAGMAVKRILLIFAIMIGLYIIFINTPSWLSFGKNGTNAEEINNVELIKMDISSARSIIIPESRDNVEVIVDGRGHASVDKKGDTLEVIYKRNWMDGLSFFNNSAEVKVFIPENYEEEMQVNVGSGSIKLAGDSEKPPLKLKALDVNMSSGNVELSNLEVDSFKHEGSSGKLSIDSMTVQSSDINMSSGIGRITNYTGELDADISSGKMDIHLKELTGDMNISANSGAITLDVPNNSDFTLKGKTGSGHISSKLALDKQVESKGELEGSMGTGKHQIKLTVSSGFGEIR